MAPNKSMARLSADEALAVLQAGNRRWVSGQAEHPSQTVERRRSLIAGQSPFAMVLSCIDPRWRQS